MNFPVLSEVNEPMTVTDRDHMSDCYKDFCIYETMFTIWMHEWPAVEYFIVTEPKMSFLIKIFAIITDTIELHFCSTQLPLHVTMFLIFWCKNFHEKCKKKWNKAFGLLLDLPQTVSSRIQHILCFPIDLSAGRLYTFIVFL